MRYTFFIVLFFISILRSYCQVDSTEYIKLYDEINKYRVEHGRKPLKRDAFLEKWCQKSVNRTSKVGNGALVHTLELMAESEILARRHNDDPPFVAVALWNSSKSHKKAMLQKNLKSMGVGIVRVGEFTFWGAWFQD